MKIRQLVPREEEVELGELLTGLSGRCAASMPPFAPEITSFCAEFSRALFKDSEARRFPELQALAFWMRKAQLARLEEEFAVMGTGRSVLVPRGLVFHVPPANVDTIFIYSWLVAVLTGNRNIIRLSPRASHQTDVVRRIYIETLAGAGEGITRNTVMVQYGHEREISEAISAAADVRVIWGGDTTVQTVRSVQLPPHAKELTFPDRYSFSAIHARNYLALDSGARRRLAQCFYNDTFWFNQMACSSPQLVIWCGTPRECTEASRSFYGHVQEQIADKAYASETGARLNKLTFACRAILDQEVSGYTEYGNELVLLQLDNLPALRREHCGGGVLFQFYAGSLDELAGFVERRDQTLTYFGFPESELKRLARLLNGVGLDRLVPVGQALSFQRFWDGYDLFQELTRHVYIGDATDSSAERHA
jgi:hypothetical protein